MALGDTRKSREEKIAFLESLHSCKRTADFSDFQITPNSNNGYSAKEISMDQLRMKNKQREHTPSPAHARFFENVFGTIAKDWFGDNTHITRTAEYDDEYNGADYVIEWPTPTGIVRLKVDLTTEERALGIKEKIIPQQSNLTRGNLGELKYFKSPITPNQKKESVTTIPEVLLHADKDRVDKLVNDLDRDGITVMKDYYLRRELVILAKDQIEDQIKILDGELRKEKSEPRKTNLQNAKNELLKVLKILKDLLPDVEKLPLSDFPKTKFQRFLLSGRLYKTFMI